MSNPNPRYFRSRGGWIIAFNGIQILSPAIFPVINSEVEVMLTFKSGRFAKINVLADEIDPLMAAFERWLTRL
jgi:hypothetical protein